MSESARSEPEKPAETPPVVVKKYANRRLYNTESSSYITLDNLAEMMLRVVRGESVAELAWHAGPVHFAADGTVARGS